METTYFGHIRPFKYSYDPHEEDDVYVCVTMDDLRKLVQAHLRNVPLALSKCIDLGIDTTDNVKIKLNESKFIEVIASVKNACCTFHLGSRAEGVSLIDSDDDLMQVMFCTNIVSSERDVILCPKTNMVLLMSLCEDNSCYCHLEFKRFGVFLGFFKLSKCINGHYYFSSSLFRDFSEQAAVDEQIPGTYCMEGPALRSFIQDFGMVKKISQSDNVTALPCKKWPDIAIEWIRRSKSEGWPRLKLIQKVKKIGIHVVPVGMAGSKDEDVQWRLSFVLAERELVRFFNYTQRQCYILLKILFKNYIHNNEDLKNVVCSYSVKTSLFWTIQKHWNIVSWIPENLIRCLVLCIADFEYMIQKEFLPHFFIRSVNLLQGKINAKNKNMIIQILQSLLTKYNIIQDKVSPGYILAPRLFTSSGNINDLIEASVNILKHVFDTKTLSFKKFDIISNILQPNLREETSEEREYYFDQTYNMSLSNLSNTLSDRFSVIGTTIKRLLELRSKPLIGSFTDIELYLCTCETLLNICFGIKCQFLSSAVWQGSYKNKDAYKLHRALDNLYVKAIPQDVCNGKLLLATYKFQNGSVEKSLKILYHVLDCLNMSFIQHVYKKDEGNSHVPRNRYKYEAFVCQKGSSLYQKTRLSFALPLCLYSVHKCIVPENVAAEFYFSPNRRKIMLNPRVYAWYLMYLCFSVKSDSKKRQEALYGMWKAINDDAWFPHDYNIAASCFMNAASCFIDADFYIVAYEMVCKSLQVHIKDNVTILYSLILIGKMLQKID